MSDVAELTNNSMKLGPGTLYDNLRKLMTQRCVEEIQKRAAGEDPRRRYYRLTGLGRRVLAAEVARLETVVQEAKGYLLGSKPRRA
jgi:DNA-binding PadR family transcriptional regulator